MINLSGSTVSGTFADADIGQYTVAYLACDVEMFCVAGQW